MGIAKSFAAKLKNEHHAVVLLFGEVGAGKTTFVAQVVHEMLGNIKTSSPTFNIVNQYSDNIFHSDMYRIKDVAELANIGFAEVLQEENIVFIEWPQIILENFGKLLADSKAKVYNVKIEVLNEGKRKITIN